MLGKKKKKGGSNFTAIRVGLRPFISLMLFFDIVHLTFFLSLSLPDDDDDSFSPSQHTLTI
jgi:hypothetical protein